jgi:hypothetical protein
MSRFMGAGRALLGAAVLVSAFVASGNARADDDDHHGGGYGGASLSLTQGPVTGAKTLASGTVSSVQVSATYAGSVWQYRVNIVAAPDRHQPKTLTCTVVVGSLADAEVIRRQAADSHAMSVTCNIGNMAAANNASLVANDANYVTVIVNMVAGANTADSVTIQHRT